MLGCSNVQCVSYTSCTLVTMISGEHNCQHSSGNKKLRTALQNTKCYKPEDHDIDVYLSETGFCRICHECSY